MSGSGFAVRPRYGRVTAFLLAASTTLVALVGTLVGDGPEEATGRSAGAGLALSGTSTGAPASAAAAALATAPSTALRAALSVGLSAPGTAPTEAGTPNRVGVPPPERSGTGRRVVFSQSQQRVWLVDAEEEVARTYLVSGSVFDNLDPGSHEVYSRSRTATGIDGSDLRYMVRFAHGDDAAIGFHSIPRMDGRRMQTRAELGTPLSHGCVRQALPDARALWRFAPVGTAVVVTA